MVGSEDDDDMNDYETHQYMQNNLAQNQEKMRNIQEA